MIIGRNNIYLAKRLKFCFILVPWIIFQELFLVWMNGRYCFVKRGNSFIITFSVLLRWLLFIKEKLSRQLLNSTTEKIFISVFTRRWGIGYPSFVSEVSRWTKSYQNASLRLQVRETSITINQSINNFINVSGRSSLHLCKLIADT